MYLPRKKNVAREFISKLHQELGITMILVTHDKEEAFMLSDKVAIFLEGHLQQLDTPINIYKQPKTIAIADFIGDANYIQGVVKNYVFSCFLGSVPVEKICAGDAKLMLRHDQINMRRNNGVPALVTDKKYKGQLTTYTLIMQIEKNPILKVTSQASNFEVGERVFIETQLQDGCVFV